MGLYSNIIEQMKLLKIATDKQTTCDKINSQIAEIEKQKEALNTTLASVFDEISKIENKIMLLKKELKSKTEDERKLENAILSQEHKMQYLVDRYNAMTKEEKTLRKYFGEI